MYGELNLASGHCPLHSLTLQVKMLWDTCTKNYCNGSKKDAPPLLYTVSSTYYSYCVEQPIQHLLFVLS